MPRILSVDIESYGKLVGRPTQTQFHPVLCRRVDKCTHQDLVLCVSITRISEDSQHIGDTIVVDMRKTAHRRLLLQWIDWADELWGMNFLYDLLFLRAFSLALKNRLDGRHTIIDLGILNYLDSELRPERSLKTIGPIFGLWKYADNVRHQRLPFDKMMSYCGEDTHNTALGIIEARRRIAEAFGSDSHKLGGWSKRFYSDLIWSVVHLEEAGVPIDVDALERLDRACEKIVATASRIAEYRGYPLSGPGSIKVRREQYTKCVEEHPDVCEHKMWKMTKETGEVSVAELNRNMLLAKLPLKHPYRTDLRLQQIHGYRSTLVTRYTKKLRGFLQPQSRSTLKLNRSVHLTYPSWFLTPGPFKDDKGGTGGTQQGRITCTNPPIQTNPKEIKNCITSRYVGGCILACDLSQVELRVAAVLSGEPVLIEIYAHDDDIHTRTAVDLFGESVLTEPSFHKGDNRTDKRQWAKQFNFARLFRAGSLKLRELILKEAGILLPWSVVQNETRRRESDWPVLWAWQEDLLVSVGRIGYCELPFTGQSRYLDPSTDHNTILNFPIQTTAGNILHRLKHYVVPRLPSRCKLFADIYDAVYIDCPSADAAASTERLVQDGIDWLERVDYWRVLCSHYGHELPLKMECHAS